MPRHRAHLAAGLGEGPDDAMMRQVTVSIGGLWASNKTAVGRKVQALRAHDAVMLIGDLAHLDGQAADKVGIPFVNVNAP